MNDKPLNLKGFNGFLFFPTVKPTIKRRMRNSARRRWGASFTDSGDSGLAIKNRYFTVQNGVACGQHWTDYITFRYDARQRDWLFHNETIQSWHLNPDPDGDSMLADPDHVTKADRKRPITFEAWRPTR